MCSQLLNPTLWGPVDSNPQEPLQHLLLVDFLDDGHSDDQCEQIPHCSFDLNFSNKCAAGF